MSKTNDFGDIVNPVSWLWDLISGITGCNCKKHLTHYGENI